MTTSYTKTLAPSRMNEIRFLFLRHTRNLHPLYTVIAFLHKQKCPDVLSFPLTPPTRNEENTTGSQGYGIVGNIWGKKLSQISRFYGYSQKFPPQNLGVWHHLRDQQAIYEFSPLYSILSWGLEPSYVLWYPNSNHHVQLLSPLAGNLIVTLSLVSSIKNK